MLQRPSIQNAPPRQVPPLYDSGDQSLVVLHDVRMLLSQIRDAVVYAKAWMSRRVPQGKVLGMSIPTVNTVDPREYHFTQNTFTVVIRNDGPNIIEFRLPNAPGITWTQLQSGEVAVFAFEEPVLPTIALRIATVGNTAAVRIWGQA